MRRSIVLLALAVLGVGPLLSTQPAHPAHLRHVAAAANQQESALTLPQETYHRGADSLQSRTPNPTEVVLGGCYRIWALEEFVRYAAPDSALGVRDSDLIVGLTDCDDYDTEERANAHDSRPVEFIAVTPMPSTGRITVRTTVPSDGSLMIVDLAGVVVMRYDGPLGAVEWHTSLTAGMYRVVLLQQNGIGSVPLVILP